MSTVRFNNQSFALTPDESLLQCFLRHGVEYPNSCQAGICQSCLIKAKDGEINPDWQEGLPETLKSQGYFLACLAKPSTSLYVASPDNAECETQAQIMSLQRLNHNVIQVKLKVEHPAPWLPGQYLSLINPEGTMRNYSIANIPADDGYIELHIKIYPQGKMGQWLLQRAAINTFIAIRGPFGQCYYHNPHNLAFDILLAGTGTGLAPLIGIIRSALTQKHEGTITLVHGGVTDRDIYYKEELEMLSLLFSNFRYDPCVLQSQGLYPEGSIEKRVLTHLHSPNTTKVYVCGPKETTNKLKTRIFLAGVPSTNIYSDVFL
ncbi:TPA: 2Fe-2S iron-sulfur cluster binding domain-containing protein [Legionella pneumophila]|uniref:FAD-binding oxidoreductase n=1 Tax=Legionella pneumophila TaxID=446 RepID=UPI0007707630|nr:FAD-binding oxidoreductase [Legionella pneumophila]HAT9006659.1 2Fe-2S iron-sulfur cluster binding domain-containing protein [Legionella pneumophila subsp. pneumophila]MDW9177031.1 FAD-binding oxidoreductase [Legionella pneumophila]CZJ93971.1 Naphthalene 1%2C2-dioxygenase system ferredoxin--NAD(+) reductase component [Legionella pneumophila]CZJ95460.1 Naphthalene 1%2C2-dioxygenase system ferredoxin--NAD(+) reductase component [Legionella pneumophila]STX87552.1 ferredoxin reductase [Legionel